MFLSCAKWENNEHSYKESAKLKFFQSDIEHLTYALQIYIQDYYDSDTF